MPEIINREHWLQELGIALQPRIQEIAQKEIPKFRLSVGWPSRAALALKRPRIGECWPVAISTEGFAEIFISPMIAETMEVAATVGHELVHAVDKNESGHKGRFVTYIRSLGLVGKPTATSAGEVFKDLADPILKALGPYPHAKMVANPNTKHQTTRMIKVTCNEKDCGYTSRTTRKWLDGVGAPLCPVHYKSMEE